MIKQTISEHTVLYIANEGEILTFDDTAAADFDIAEYNSFDRTYCGTAHAAPHTVTAAEDAQLRERAEKARGERHSAEEQAIHSGQ